MVVVAPMMAFDNDDGAGGGNDAHDGVDADVDGGSDSENLVIFIGRGGGRG